MRIHTDRHGACGVGLEDGSQLEAARVVASSVDAHLTFERMLAPDVLPEEFREAVARIDYSSASAKINLALAEPPQIYLHARRRRRPHHHGTMHIGPSLDYIERAYDDAKYGRPSRDPILEMHDAHQRRPDDRPAGQTHPVDLRAVRPVQTGRRELGRHQRVVCRSLHRDARPVRPQRARRDRASPGSQPARPGTHLRHSPAATSCRGPCRRTSSTASAPSPAGPTTARPFRDCTCAAPPAIPAAA